jgi:hypothetical protein
VSELTTTQADTPMSEALALMAEVMVRFRHEGGSHRNIARLFGWSRSAFYRDIAGPLDRVVSQLGQDRAENTRLIDEWVSHLGQIEIGPRPKRRPSLPRDSEAVRLMANLASLGQLINRDPRDILADMPPEMQNEAVRLAARVAPWLAQMSKPDG